MCYDNCLKNIVLKRKIPVNYGRGYACKEEIPVAEGGKRYAQASDARGSRQTSHIPTAIKGRHRSWPMVIQPKAR